MRSVALPAHVAGAVVAGCLALGACERGADRKRAAELGLVRDSMLAELASAPVEPVVPPAAIRAALDSVYRVMQQSAQASVARRSGLDDTVAMLRHEMGRLALSVVALRDSLHAFRQAGAGFTDTARGRELALVEARNAAAMDRLHQLLAEKDARLDTLTSLAGALRDSLGDARSLTERLLQQLDGFSSELGAARQAVDVLQTEVTSLNERVAVLDGDKHRVAVCVGTGENLQARGVAERRGGVRGVRAAWTVRRGASFDECHDRFDWRDRRTVALLPAARGKDAHRFEVLSAHDPSLLRLEEIDDSRRYGLVVDEPERFWAAGPVLVVRLR